MPNYFWFATPVDKNGVATANSTVVSVWVGALPHPAAPPSYDLYINDKTKDGLIDSKEWGAMTGGGLGLNGGAEFKLFWGFPKGAGTIYSSVSHIKGAIGLKAGLINNFVVDPRNLDTRARCFMRDSHILMADGHEVAVQDIQPGDEVQLHDGRSAKVVLLSMTKLCHDMLKTKPHLLPVRIPAHAFGQGCPKKDLYVSYNHRIFLTDPLTKRPVLMAAHYLIGYHGINLVHDLTQIEYYHVILRQHEVIVSEGLPCESCLLGDQACRIMDQGEMACLLAHQPDIFDTNSPDETMQPIIEGARARKIARALFHDRPVLKARHNPFDAANAETVPDRPILHQRGAEA